MWTLLGALWLWFLFPVAIHYQRRARREAEASGGLYGGDDDGVLFPTRRGGHLSPDSIGDLADRYVAIAQQRYPSWTAGRVTPHTLRHTAAMTLLAAGVETSVIALWLGHEHIQTTQIYLHGDLTMKQRALDRTTPPGTPPGRYRAPDPLIAFLEDL